MTSVPETAGPVTFVLDGGGGAKPPPPVAPDALSATIKATTVRTAAVLLIVLLLCVAAAEGVPAERRGWGSWGGGATRAGPGGTAGRTAPAPGRRRRSRQLGSPPP